MNVLILFSLLVSASLCHVKRSTREEKTRSERKERESKSRSSKNREPARKETKFRRHETGGCYAPFFSCPSWAPCCSKHGFCGNTADHCSRKNCLANCWNDGTPEEEAAAKRAEKGRFMEKVKAYRSGDLRGMSEQDRKDIELYEMRLMAERQHRQDIKDREERRNKVMTPEEREAIYLDLRPRDPRWFPSFTTRDPWKNFDRK